MSRAGLADTDQGQGPRDGQESGLEVTGSQQTARSQRCAERVDLCSVKRPGFHGGTATRLARSWCSIGPVRPAGLSAQLTPVSAPRIEHEMISPATILGSPADGAETRQLPAAMGGLRETRAAGVPGVVRLFAGRAPGLMGMMHVFWTCLQPVGLGWPRGRGRRAGRVQ
jgi:hypothetical protein